MMQFYFSNCEDLWEDFLGQTLRKLPESGSYILILKLTSKI
jgi:hypothetical protein